MLQLSQMPILQCISYQGSLFPIMQSRPLMKVPLQDDWSLRKIFTSGMKIRSIWKNEPETLKWNSNPSNRRLLMLPLSQVCVRIPLALKILSKQDMIQYESQYDFEGRMSRFPREGTFFGLLVIEKSSSTQYGSLIINNQESPWSARPHILKGSSDL